LTHDIFATVAIMQQLLVYNNSKVI